VYCPNTTIGVGSVRIFQNSSNALVSGVNDMSKHLHEAYQLVFFMAAYFDTIDQSHLLRAWSFFLRAIYVLTRHRRSGPATLHA
jgi:hypothetical protein